MLTTKPRSLWPARIGWPRREDQILPALTGISPMPLPYVRGRSRFTLSPLYLTLDQLLFLIAAALLAFGLVMVQSADARISAPSDQWWLKPFATKNMAHAGAALLTLLIVWRFDYRKLLGPNIFRSPATYLVLITFLLLLAVLGTPLGRVVNGAKRWLEIPGIHMGFQPSELAKLGLVLFISAYALHQEVLLRRLWRGFLPLVAAFGVVLVLILKEDFGTTVLIATVCFILLLMAGCKWWHLLLLLPPAGMGAYLMLSDPFRVARLVAFLDPMADPKGAGYHPLQSLLTIVSGGFWGRGLGNGIQKMGYLPEDNTDFIFAVVCEELGFFGAFMIIALFFVFVLVGWRIMSRCNNLFGKMIAFGITALIGLQAAMNIAVVTVSMPTKGIALPLISSGGTGWIMTAMAIGVLMSIERINRQDEEALHRTNEPTPAQPMGFEVVLPKTPQPQPSKTL